MKSALPVSAKRFFCPIPPAVPAAIVFLGMVLAALAAPANAVSSMESSERPYPVNDPGVRIVMASAAPDAVSFAPRSRPSSQAGSVTADAGIPRPLAKPKPTPNLPASNSAATRSDRIAAKQVPYPPVPPRRPDGLTGRTAIPSSGPMANTPSASAAAGSTAAATGALPGETSLIGVMETKAGREALLRTGAGQVVKVTYGNMVDGWQVNSIDRDAVRLTRAGETRTLRMISN